MQVDPDAVIKKEKKRKKERKKERKKKRGTIETIKIECLECENLEPCFKRVV